MDYLDFDIEIGVGSGRKYPVAVIRSTAGEAHETMQFPFDVEALFTGGVRTCYALSQREAFHRGKGVRLKLRIQSPRLAALPWEFLYDAGQAEYVCLSSNTPIVRYLELPQPPQPLSVGLPLRILGMIASPKDLAELDVEREKQRVEKALQHLQAKGTVELTWLLGQTWQELQRSMRFGPWHIFHFIGHGGFDPNTDEGLIALEDDEGRAQYLSATHLGRLLADHRPLRLVVLNSCEGARGSEKDIFSSTAAILVRRGIPAVLAMQYEITDRAAIALSRAFYEALADGLPVDMAVSEARKSVSLGVANTVEWGTPVLYMRSPDGVLFDLIQKPDSVFDRVLGSKEASTEAPLPSPDIPEEITMKSWFMAGSHPQDYKQGIDRSVTYNGKNSAYLKAKVAQQGGFGTLMQMFKADYYRNKRMRLSATVKSVGLEGWAGLWMRIDGPEEKVLGFDNMQNRPIKGATDWQKYEVVLDVPQESVHIAFGILLEGKGQVWLSDVRFEEVQADVPVTSVEFAYPEQPENLDFGNPERED